MRNFKTSFQNANEERDKVSYFHTQFNASDMLCGSFYTHTECMI